MNRLFTAAIAGTLAIQPVAATAQETRLEPVNFEAATLYALPHLFKGYTTVCADVLSSDGYVATNADRLSAKFAGASDGTWPQARDALGQLAAKEGGSEGADLLTMMPDGSLKPFIDGILFALVSTEMKPERCSDVERALELFDPMPAENIAGLMGFIMEMVERDKAEKRARAEALAAESDADHD